jgi:hypothetical protein
MPFLLLIIALAICLYTAVVGKRQYDQFAGSSDTSTRIGFYLRWIAESWILLGAFSVLALWLLGELQHLVHPIISTSLTSSLPAPLRDDPGALSGFFIGLAAGIALLAVRIVIQLRRGRKLPTIGDYSALLPRNNRERGHMVAVC